jgi:hypothetical protein
MAHDREWATCAFSWSRRNSDAVTSRSYSCPYLAPSDDIWVAVLPVSPLTPPLLGYQLSERQHEQQDYVSRLKSARPAVSGIPLQRSALLTVVPESPDGEKDGASDGMDAATDDECDRASTAANDDDEVSPSRRRASFGARVSVVSSAGGSIADSSTLGKEASMWRARKFLERYLRVTPLDAHPLFDCALGRVRPKGPESATVRCRSLCSLFYWGRWS